MRAYHSLGLMVFLLAGCASQGPTTEPFSRTAQWFSYLNGDDLRRDCQPGAPDRARIVYNAVWGEQVRTYDLRPDGAGRYQLDSRVFGGLRIDHFRLDDPLAVGRGRSASRALTNAQALSLIQGLEQAGLGQPTPAGQFLWSDTYYWVATVCEGGRIRFQAWPEEREGAVARALLPRLRELDQNEVGFARPPAVTVVRRGQNNVGPAMDGNENFSLQIGRDGLLTGGKI